MAGSKPGERRGGRQRGTKNKATVEREINAAAVIDRARREGRELAVDVLEKLMKVAEGAAAINRPTEQKKYKDGDWKLFAEWFDRTAFCAKALAPFQSPTFKAVAVDVRSTTPAPMQQLSPPPLQIEGPTDQNSSVKCYLRAIKGGKA
jgi:hypothetical protein